jgi:branched-chain amino acid transport system ATP-binding protein
MSSDPLLELRGVDVAVEGFTVATDIDLEVGSSEAVGLVGRNGAGKTSTFRGIMGLTEVLDGSIRYNGMELTEMPAQSIPHQGIGYQPEDRKLFTGMTVEENLRLPIWTSSTDYTEEEEEEIIQRIYDVFDEVSDRRDAKVENLSGGEGKMTAIGRALALEPDLLILDEPLEGLAPIIVENLKEYIKEINELGIAVLVAESNASHVPEVADRMYVIERGEILAEGDPEALAEDEEIQRYLQG